MKLKKNIITATLVLLSMSGVSISNALEQSRTDLKNEHNEAQTGFFSGREDGWFFYNEIIEEEPEEMEPPEEPKPIASVPEEQKKEVADVVVDSPKHLSAAWLRENLDRYKDIAIDNPTMENVTAYLYMQRFAMDKSEIFADAVEMATIGNPYLDENVRRPASTVGSRAIDHFARVNFDKLVTKLSEKVAVFFFYHSASPEALIQAKPLKYLNSRYGVIIYAISLDGKQLPEGHFPDFKTNDGQAEFMGVDIVPSIYIVSTDGDYAPIAHGITSLDSLAKNMVVVSRRKGWITEEEYAKTRPTVNEETNTVPLFETLIDEFQKSDNKDDGNFIDPDVLTKHIKNILQN